MRTEQQYLDEYARSHQNPTNQIIHMVCVPLIFWATLAMLWHIPLAGLIPGLPAAWAPYANLAVLGLPVVIGFYAMLSARAVAVGMVWLALSFALTLGGLAAGWPVLWIAAAVWVIAWIVQVYGHKVEGAKPSFIDDVLFLLVGPLFVQEKFERLLTTGSYRAKAH